MSSPLDTLTKRQREIVRALVEGKSGKEVAHDLFICYGSLKNHIATINRALGTTNRAQIAYLYGRWEATKERNAR